VSELGLGVGAGRVAWASGVPRGGVAAGVFELAADRVELEDLSLLAGGFAQLAVEMAKRGEGLTVG